MVCKFFNLKLRRVISVFLMSTMMILSFIPSVYAVPDTSSDVPGNVSNPGWIDLVATVPEGFSGSVFVQIRNTADDSYYDVECFVLNDFKNSKQVPLGNYEVVAVETSENPFLYYASCETEGFELTNSYSLHVVVEKISDNDSDSALADSIESQETISELTNDEEDNSIESTDLPTGDTTEDTIDEKPGVVDDEGLNAIPDDTTEVEKETKSSSRSVLISFVFSVSLILVAAFVFWKFKNR